MSASSATLAAASAPADVSALEDAVPNADKSKAEGKSKGQSKGKSKLAIIGLVVAIAALAFVFLKPSAAESTEPSEPVPGEVVEVGQMTVNLADATRYARVSFSLVLVEGLTVDAVAAKYPYLKEAVLFEFSKVSAPDLRAPGGLDGIATRLSEGARAIYTDGEVIRLVLTELLVQ